MRWRDKPSKVGLAISGHGVHMRRRIVVPEPVEKPEIHFLRDRFCFWSLPTRLLLGNLVVLCPVRFLEFLQAWWEFILHVGIGQQLVTRFIHRQEGVFLEF